MDWNQVRAEFPALTNRVFLDATRSVLGRLSLPTPIVILRNVVTKNPSPQQVKANGQPPLTCP